MVRSAKLAFLYHLLMQLELLNLTMFLGMFSVSSLQRVCDPDTVMTSHTDYVQCQMSRL